MKHVLSTTAVAASLFLAPTITQAASIILPEGETTVEVTAPLASLGLGAMELGIATLGLSEDGNPLFTFPITGGTADDDGLIIEHEGSGVMLFALDDDEDDEPEDVDATVAGLTLAANEEDDGDPTISAENFVIDTALGTVSGNVNGGDSLVTLFNFGVIDEDGIDLLISEELAEALSELFDAPDLTGAVFGVANTAPVLPAPVPLPAGAALLLTGLGALAWRQLRTN